MRLVYKALNSSGPSYSLSPESKLNSFCVPDVLNKLLENYRSADMLSSFKFLLLFFLLFFLNKEMATEIYLNDFCTHVSVCLSNF